MDSDKKYNNFVKKYLLDKGYTDVQPLGSGSFGDAFSAMSPQKTEVAIKIISKESSWQMEEHFWPILNHSNILPTLEVMKIDDAGCNLYVMPKHPATLGNVLKTSTFQKDPKKFVRMKKWFSDVLEALDYLHKAELCHLDLKTDNILISSNDSAILCDFSGLNSIGINLDRFVSPCKYRPPECFGENGDKVEGVSYDMWTFGILVLNCLTNFWPGRHMGDENKPNWSWKGNVKPVIQIYLREAIFKKVLHKAFPLTLISEKDRSNALDFVKGLLNMDPKGRFTASEAMNHAFLKEDSHINLSGESDIFESHLVKDSDSICHSKKESKVLETPSMSGCKRESRKRCFENISES